MKEQTSIQISTSIRDLLKSFCEDHGYKMNRFVELAILQSITGSYKIQDSYENDKTSSREKSL